MQNPNTEECDESKGREFIAKDKQSLAFIKRLQKIDRVFCDVRNRMESSLIKLGKYCEDVSIDPPFTNTEEPESETTCVLVKKTIVPDYLYLVTVNDLNQEMYDLIESLEQEVCAMLEKLSEFEAIVKNNCSNEEDSSSSSSYPEETSSSSNSSTSESSSSSSSTQSSSSDFPYEPIDEEDDSGPSFLDYPESIHVAAYCEEGVNITKKLFRTDPSIVEGPEYVELYIDGVTPFGIKAYRAGIINGKTSFTSNGLAARKELESWLFVYYDAGYWYHDHYEEGSVGSSSFVSDASIDDLPHLATWDTNTLQYTIGVGEVGIFYGEEPPSVDYINLIYVDVLGLWQIRSNLEVIAVKESTSVRMSGEYQFTSGPCENQSVFIV